MDSENINGIKNMVIDCILSSDLNIESIDDDLERQLYEIILTGIERIANEKINRWRFACCQSK